MIWLTIGAAPWRNMNRNPLVGALKALVAAVDSIVRSERDHHPIRIVDACLAVRFPDSATSGSLKSTLVGPRGIRPVGREEGYLMANMVVVSIGATCCVARTSDPQNIGCVM